MSSLETTFLDITFPNPFILAAGPPTENGAMVIEAFKAGWGGAVLKTIALAPTIDPSPRLHIIKTGRTKWGMLDIELISKMSVDKWEEEIDMIRDAFPERPIIASVMGGGNAHDWQEVIRRLEPHGVNAFEMNASCPNFAEEKGSKLGQDPESLGLAVRWVREATHLPVIAKLTPNVTDIVQLARVAMEAGADAVTATNSLVGIAGIDLTTFAPMPTVDGIGIAGGYGGPGLKPVSLRCTADIAKNLSIPIFGCGGISKWQHAAEYLTAGASAVQICTAVMWEGRQIITKLTKGLEKYLERNRFETPTDIIGKALPNIGKFPDLNLEVKMVASVDEERCNGCGICVVACNSGGYQAIELADSIVQINPQKCDGCGLCVGICPLTAVLMLPIDASK
jgi:dihydropyrimidine dehydrogenase (NAD+) subunit PreA